MTDTAINILIGAAGSLLAVLLVWVFGKGRVLAIFFGQAGKLAMRFAAEGITRFNFDRNDYVVKPRDYLASAKRSIDIVSISLSLPNREGRLAELFREKIFAEATFRIRVSVLKPDSPVCEVAAKSLDIPVNQLRSEIEELLKELTELKRTLPSDRQHQLKLFTHELIPMGSVIMLDATPTSGIIQVETKLFKAPRTLSFGFEITAPTKTSFYRNQFHHWQLVFESAVEVK